MKWTKYGKLIGFLIIGFGIVDYMSDDISKLWKKTWPKSTPTKITEEIPITAKPLPATLKKWKICWRKPPGVKGIFPNHRQDCSKRNHVIRIIRDEPNFFEMTWSFPEGNKRCKATFYWDKIANPTAGLWEQDCPKNWGNFYLEKVGNIYVGSHSNKMGEDTPFWVIPEE